VNTVRRELSHTEVTEFTEEEVRRKKAAARNAHPFALLVFLFHYVYQMLAVA
jgi:hypothetical protein